MKAKVMFLFLVGFCLFIFGCEKEKTAKDISEPTAQEIEKLSPEQVVDRLLEYAIKKCDYKACYDMLANKDKAEIRKYQLLYQFIIEDNTNLSSKYICWFNFLRSLFNLPSSIVEYEILDHYEENNMKIVPVVFKSINMEKSNEYIEYVDNKICQLDIPIEQRLDSIKTYISKIENIMEDEKRTKHTQSRLYLITEGEKIKVSLLANPMTEDFYEQILDLLQLIVN